MTFSLYAIWLWALASLVSSFPNPDYAQQRLGTSTSQEIDVIKKFINASIIPEVIDIFEPQFILQANWTNGTMPDLGNYISPSLLQHPPERIILELLDPAVHMKNTIIVLTDPDALSRKNPVWSEMCHWIEYVHSKSSKVKAKGIKSYFPPGPPPKTGAHRYVMLVLTPVNGTSKKLHLTKPASRKHWGYDGMRVGVRKWAEENELKVVAGNFFYAKHEKE